MVTLSIEGVSTDTPRAITSGETALQLLEALNATDPNLKLTTKAYSGMGVLVEGIGGKTNGTDQKYWQYKVNGTMPMVGADQYQLASGDSIEWYFTGSQN
jgi:hypothetical protein